ncbi:MAG: mechanosensitive ion channel [Elusimicrobia bacterium]|nr:mechanosensitive ion channel [Elusimicrobiota bacterium]
MSFREAFVEAVGPVLTGVLPLLFGAIAVLYALVRSSRRRLAAAAAMAGAALLFLALSAAVFAWGGGIPDRAVRLLRAAGQLGAALAAINAVGVVLFDIVLPRLRVHLSALARDLILAVAYALGVLGGLTAAGVDFSGLIATSAVMTAILAFSLQDTLGNVLGGMVLQLDQTLHPGDWVRVGADEGVVREIRWRQTQIATAAGDVIVVPNSQLMKSVVVALGRAAGRRRRYAFGFSVPLAWGPSEVIAVVEKALRDDPAPFVAADPPPTVVAAELGAGTAAYSARIWVTDFTKDADALSGARVRAFYALARAGIALAVEPSQSVAFEDARAVRERRAADEDARRLAALRGVDLFQPLTPDELRALAARLRPAPFARGEAMTRQGAAGRWLYVLARGEAEVQLRDSRGAEKVARLKAGDYMGEMALLTGEPRSATVVAVEDVDSYRLDAESFREVLAKRPELAESVARKLAERRAGLESARGVRDERRREELLRGDSADLLTQIRRFFAL